MSRSRPWVGLWLLPSRSVTQPAVEDKSAAPRVGFDLRQEIDNVRAALRWALTDAPLKALLAGLLSEYWRLRGEPNALAWLRAALDATGEAVPARDRARAYLGISSRLSLQADVHSAEEAAGAALDCYRSAEDEAGMAQAWLRLAAIHSQAGDRQLARRDARAAVRHAEVNGENGLTGRALSRFAMYVPSGERDAIFVPAIDLLTAAGAHSQLADLYLNAGFRALCEDQIEPAFDLLEPGCLSGRSPIRLPRCACSSPATSAEPVHSQNNPQPHERPSANSCFCVANTAFVSAAKRDSPELLH